MDGFQCFLKQLVLLMELTYPSYAHRTMHLITTTVKSILILAIV